MSCGCGPAYDWQECVAWIWRKVKEGEETTTIHQQEDDERAMRDRDEDEIKVEMLCGVMRTSSGVWCTESDGGSRKWGGTSLAKTSAKGGRDEVEMRSKRAR